MRRIFFVVALAWLCHSSLGQTVGNVRASQRAETRLVDIYYDLTASTSAYVMVAVSTNDGVSYDVPAWTLTSAPGTTSVGANVVPGNNRHIIWNAGVDWSNRFSNLVRVQVTAYADGTAPSGMTLIPAGSNSGSNPLGSGESYDPVWYPQTYSLTVSAFYMDRTEVTKAQWDEVRSWGLTHGYTDLSVGGGKSANHPVQTVTWYDVVKWCNARSEKEGKPVSYQVWGSVYRIGQSNAVACATNIAGYRLPTDVEWEYAARGGVTSHRFPWSDSDTIQHARANYYSSSSYSYDTSPTRGYHPTYTNGAPYTSPVGSFAPNGYGLYDMAGNVWEWCWDWHPGYVGSIRVFRGGSWDDYAAYCRVAYRYAYYPNSAYDALGFRAVLPSGQ